MGTATGILAKTAEKFLDKKNITVADINKKAIQNLKQEGYNAIQSDLFKNLPVTQVKPTTNNQQPTTLNRYDLILFNAPYLPKDNREPKDSQVATTGGKRGDEIPLKFLTQAKRHLTKKGKIFLLISSLTPMDKINKHNPKIVATKNLFMEKLLILKFTQPKYPVKQPTKKLSQ
jgi:methylase of polypeptide subunit release factors